MSCLKNFDLWAYLENELSSEQQLKCEEHLKSCPTCQRRLAERRSFLESIKKLPDLKLPSDFAQRVMDRLPETRFRTRGLIYLAGGIYFLFTLMVTVLAFGRQGAIFDLCQAAFRYLFNLASDLSRLIINLLQLGLALFKALKILFVTWSRLITGFLPAASFFFIALIFLIILTGSLTWFLLRPGRLSPRSNHYENPVQ